MSRKIIAFFVAMTLMTGCAVTAFAYSDTVDDVQILSDSVDSADSELPIDDEKTEPPVEDNTQDQPEQVQKIDISVCDISLVKSSYAYKADKIRPSVTVTDSNGKELERGVDFKLTYTNNQEIGTATAVVTGIGDYSGTVKLNFDIVPAKVTVKSQYSASESAVRINWQKADAAQGYKVYRSTGKSWKLIATVSSADKLTYRDKNCTSGTAYSYRVCAYKKVGNKTYCGEFGKTVYTATKPQAVDVTVSAVNSSAVRLKWSKQKCTGYQIFYKKSDGSWKKLKTIKDSSAKTYKISNLKAGKKYTFKVRAYTADTSGGYSFGKFTAVSATTKHSKTATKLYNIKYTTSFYDTNLNYQGSLYSGAAYSGYETTKFPGYVVLDYKLGKVLVKKSSVSVRTNAKVLATSAIGQYGGRIAGYAACGPTAVAILVDSEKNASWNKDSLIEYSERNRLNDQGSLRSGGGMTAPKLLQLISGYSGGKYTARNIYSSNPSAILKNQIDSGHRAIVVVQYTSYIVTHYSSGTHFVVVCGYEYINGTLYFYYADPYYGGGGRSLLRVSSSQLSASMNMVVREPRTLIVLN